MTERLYYTDPYLRDFEAHVASIDGNRLYLDRTAFYPASGGQPNDLGTIAGIAVEDVVDEGDRIAHVLASAPGSGVITGTIDWPRRFDHMQQHSGQHLLSAVLIELFDIHTVSFHLGTVFSTIDVEASGLDSQQVNRTEQRIAEIVFENRPIGITFASSADPGLRKPSEREGELRIVSIADLDRSACGGTHVRSTAEIGPVLIRKLDRIRGNVRIEFLCGLRAIRRARADFDALSRVARTFSASIDEAPDLVASQSERIQQIEKAYRKLAAEAANRQGRDLYAATEPGPDGIRRTIRNGRIDDDMRAMAQGFVTSPKAVFTAICADPPSVLVAASKDSGVHAGNLVKSAVTPHGGRGGGSPVLGQGSVPDATALSHVKTAIR